MFVKPTDVSGRAERSSEEEEEEEETQTHVATNKKTKQKLFNGYRTSDALL